MVVLITGATGFIGSNLVRHFSQRGVDVIAAANKGERENWRTYQHPRVRWAHIDLCEKGAVASLIKASSPMVILHCAAYGAYAVQSNVERIYEVNVTATRFLVEAAAECNTLRSFVHAGTSSEYGDHCTAPDELDHPLPDSHYAVSKLMATELLGYYSRKLRFPAQILRLYSVYGPFEETSRLVPRLLTLGQQGALPPLVDPDVARDFVYIDDVVEAFWLAATAREPGCFNIGTGKSTTLRELVELTKKIFAIDVDPVWGSMPNRKWDQRDWKARPERAIRNLGWQAKYDLAQGLRATLAWMQKNGSLLKVAELEDVLNRSTDSNA